MFRFFIGNKKNTQPGLFQSIPKTWKEEGWDAGSLVNFHVDSANEMASQINEKLSKPEPIEQACLDTLQSYRMDTLQLIKTLKIQKQPSGASGDIYDDGGECYLWQESKLLESGFNNSRSRCFPGKLVNNLSHPSILQQTADPETIKRHREHYEHLLNSSASQEKQDCSSSFFNYANTIEKFYKRVLDTNVEGGLYGISYPEPYRSDEGHLNIAKDSVERCLSFSRLANPFKK